jgi:hypothetical protein
MNPGEVRSTIDTRHSYSTLICSLISSTRPNFSKQSIPRLYHSTEAQSSNTCTRYSCSTPILDPLSTLFSKPALFSRVKPRACAYKPLLPARQAQVRFHFSIPEGGCVGDGDYWMPHLHATASSSLRRGQAAA